MPNSINEFNSRMERTEERINELQYRAIKITQTEKTENRLKKQTNKASGIYSKTTKSLTFL